MEMVEGGTRGTNGKQWKMMKEEEEKREGTGGWEVRGPDYDVDGVPLN